MFHPFDVILVSLHNAIATICETLANVHDGLREAARVTEALPPVPWLHPAILGGLPFAVVPAAGLIGFCVLLNYLEAKQTSLSRDLRTGIAVLILGLLIYGVTA